MVGREVTVVYLEALVPVVLVERGELLVRRELCMLVVLLDITMELFYCILIPHPT